MTRLMMLWLACASVVLGCNQGSAVEKGDPSKAAEPKTAAPSDWLAGTWRLALNERFKVEPKYLDAYTFRPNGKVVMRNPGYGEHHLGDWRQDAQGRLFLKMDHEATERRLRQKGAMLLIARLPSPTMLPHALTHLTFKRMPEGDL